MMAGTTRTERGADEVRCEVTVDAPIERAFAVFTERLGAWWPAEFTFAEEGFATAEIEPREGGRWLERDRSGEERSWGEVRSWEPPRRVVLSWRVSPQRTQEPPERASEVEIRFHGAGPARTRVEAIHRDFGRHGEGAAAVRAGMASEEGWAGLLERYRREAG